MLLLNVLLKKLYDEGLIVTEGKGRSTKYALSSPYDLFYPLDINEYFKNEQDQRKVKDAFDFVYSKPCSYFSTIKSLNKIVSPCPMIKYVGIELSINSYSLSA